jgi:hypothetical protein
MSRVCEKNIARGITATVSAQQSCGSWFMSLGVFFVSAIA